MAHTVYIAFHVFVGLDRYPLEISVCPDMGIIVFFPPFRIRSILDQLVENSVLNGFGLCVIAIYFLLAGNKQLFD